MLLDPFKGRFHLPAIFVQRGSGEGWQRGVVGHEDRCLAGLGIFEKRNSNREHPCIAHDPHQHWLCPPLTLIKPDTSDGGFLRILLIDLRYVVGVLILAKPIHSFTRKQPT